MADKDKDIEVKDGKFLVKEGETDIAGSKKIQYKQGKNLGKVFILEDVAESESDDDMVPVVKKNL